MNLPAPRGNRPQRGARRLGRRIWIVLTISALLAAPPLAHAQRPRPDEVAPAQVVTAFAPDELSVYNDYATPSRTYSSRRAVVHYVVRGVDAPPLNDDDGDGVPDYVERVGDAADTAIGYYERRGFVPIRRDQGGPDARPDLYITRFAPGYFGLSIPAPDAVGGAFAAISNSLDPSPEQSLGSLYATVAHELFHLVQFSYFTASKARHSQAGYSKARLQQPKTASTRTSRTSSPPCSWGRGSRRRRSR